MSFKLIPIITRGLSVRGVLMIQQGAHPWLTAPHPSVAFSISVRPNGIRSVIIRLFTVHVGLTVNFWDMTPLSSSNLFFSELQRTFISRFWRLVSRTCPPTVSLFRFPFTASDHGQLLFLMGQLWKEGRVYLLLFTLLIANRLLSQAFWDTCKVE